jgi:hypothetical protein
VYKDLNDDGERRRRLIASGRDCHSERQTDFVAYCGADDRIDLCHGTDTIEQLVLDDEGTRITALALRHRHLLVATQRDVRCYYIAPPQPAGLVD